ncbi:winged helix DNA-binding domain-containing protein [Blastococcus sp. MG754426]|uniref:winged helix DNA-binding domain-containing protein n=1 Tax=unclassified Blastococcus TaxID=2619396 RepID=UPI001EEFD7A3|nr:MULTISPECIES: winged helix DNA-binding domain-containing protein [unclassified Blastococcus]MCF6506947.1 winged helix DNA-binding domain-containing protein [Blastococcus sp. MG754426]MCF6511807.1 winged helix DNA-binding domain-containing protein [Blastococcus sp. MG754427]MCF6735962.1 winged helix DNA-binding domain-containing protein [Blastococcus sp. KM273129]
MTTLHDVALLRLVAQRLAGPPATDAAAAVHRLLAVQGQDFPGAVTSVALRTRARDRAAVLHALDTGAVVRSWPMRGTLHLVPAGDLPWMLELLGPRALAGLAGRRAALRLTDADAERARELAVAALSGGRRLTRRALLAAVDEGGVATTGQRGYHLLWFLAQTGTLCLGPTEDGEQLFVLLDEWVRGPRRLAREEALAELVLRYFLGHGPATVHDLVRWAGTTVRDVRTGLDAVRDRLARVEVEGTEQYLDPETLDRCAAHREAARAPLLLPGFDEFVLGYADREAVLDPAHAERIVPGRNGVFRPTVVVDGRVTGTWRRAGRGAARTVEAEPFTGWDATVAEAVPRLAAALP